MTRINCIIIGSVLLGVLATTYSFAQEPYTLDKIVVTSDRESAGNHSLKNNYSLQTWDAYDIKQKNLNSLVDLLNSISGVDLRYRGTSGIQGDLSLRGSTFEQVAVLIDGIRVMDPQTGHHNLDIPLTRFDVERVEATKEGVSSLYGTGSLAGSINFITKQPTKKALNMESSFGEHALFGNAFSLSMPSQVSSGRLSFEHKVSKAATPNTDFEYSTATLTLAREFQDSKVDTFLGYQKKDFGADSFYSNLFPEEEEHTNTFFIRTGLDNRLGFGLLKNDLTFRKHRDKFILKRNNPTSVNYHTTYVYGLSSSLEVPLKYSDLLLGIDTGMDEINSTNLGKHEREHESWSLGFIPRLKDDLTVDLRLRLDRYQKWGLQESHNLGLGYFLIDKKLKINGSLGHAFRIPSFTELFYSDAGNKGNSSLSMEESDNFRLGVNFEDGIISSSLDGYLRRGRNLIDWTRSTDAQVWTATNLGKVDFSGMEFTCRLRPQLSYKGAAIEKIIFSYNYTNSNNKATSFFSKYALDILKHQLNLEINSIVAGINFNWELSYNQRYFGETYFLGNLVLSKPIQCKGFIFEPFLKIDNFSDTHYSEVGGVLQPGRWIQSGFKFEW